MAKNCCGGGRCFCSVVEGFGIDVEGTGAANNPFIISAALAALDHFFYPSSYGAVDDREVDSITAINACIQAAYDFGNGIIFVDGQYGWTGDLLHLGGVTVMGGGRRRGTITGLTTPDRENGFFALDSTARYRYGQWGGGDSENDNPGPLLNLIIHGMSVADELARMECTNGTIRDCDIVYAASGGKCLETGRSQNSTVDNSFIGLATGGKSLSIDTSTGGQGAGMVHFNNCYIATSRYLLYADCDPLNFAQHQITFNDCLFENYIAGNDLVWLKSGAYKFNDCILTNSAGGGAGGVTPNDCLILIENDTHPTESTTVAFSGGDLVSSGGNLHALVRIKNSNSATHVFNKFYREGKTNMSFADYVYCVDGGGTGGVFNSATISDGGEAFRFNGTLDWIHTENGGTKVNFVRRVYGPMQHVLPVDATGTQLAAETYRLDVDDADRIRIDPANRGIFMYDGLSGSTPVGSWYWDNTTVPAHPRMVMGHVVQFANGIALSSIQHNISTPGQAVTINPENSPMKILNFTADNATANITVSDCVNTTEMKIMVINNGHTGTAINWPANVHFRSTSFQPSGSNRVILTFYNVAGTDWYEEGAGTAAAATAATTSFTPTGGISATDVQAMGAELDTEKAPLASPALTGNPTAPTQTAGDNSTKIATTAYVDTVIRPGTIIARTTYNPAALTTFDTSAASTADEDISAANLTITGTVPATGNIWIELVGTGSSTPGAAAAHWMLRTTGGATVAGTKANIAVNTNRTRAVHKVLLTGLTPGATFTYRWGQSTSSSTNPARFYCGDAGGATVYGQASMIAIAAA